LSVVVEQREERRLGLRRGCSLEALEDETKEFRGGRGRGRYEKSSSKREGESVGSVSVLLKFGLKRDFPFIEESEAGEAVSCSVPLRKTAVFTFPKLTRLESAFFLMRGDLRIRISIRLRQPAKFIFFVIDLKE
jgi:hypothetical protein